MRMIDDVKVKNLRVIPDERGWLMEILRDDDSIYTRFGQVYLSVVYPNVVKGWHFHKTQTDNMTVIKGMAKIVLYDGRETSPTSGEINEFFVGEKKPLLISIPPGVYHGMKGIGTEPAYMINIPDKHYNYEAPDEYRVDPFNNNIPYTWKIKEG